MKENNHYVYRHRRLDDFSIFYIGMGGQPNLSRAYNDTQRSEYWKRVVNKHGH